MGRVHPHARFLSSILVTLKTGKKVSIKIDASGRIVNQKEELKSLNEEFNAPIVQIPEKQEVLLEIPSSSYDIMGIFQIDLDSFSSPFEEDSFDQLYGL